MKKSASFALALIMCITLAFGVAKFFPIQTLSAKADDPVSVWDSNIDYSYLYDDYCNDPNPDTGIVFDEIDSLFAGGDGSSQNPYLISNGNQLALVSYLCAQSDLWWMTDRYGNFYNWLNYRLTDNIYLNDISAYGAWDELNPPDNIWTPIRNFSGRFNGNGFAVYGMYIYAGDNQSYGLFDNVYDAAIYNLGVEYSYVKDDYDQTDSINCVGGIAGSANSTVFKNCYNTGSVYGFTAGGIVGSSEFSQILYCGNSGEISGECCTGGIAGNSFIDTIVGCYNTANLTEWQGELANNGIGGIAGVTSEDEILNCYNTGDINGITSGGICGRVATPNSGTSIVNCYNSGEVTSLAFYPGGILGINNDDTTVVEYCYYTQYNGEDAVGNDYGPAYTNNIDTTYDAQLLQSWVDSPSVDVPYGAVYSHWAFDDNSNSIILVRTPVAVNFETNGCDANNMPQTQNLLAGDWINTVADPQSDANEFLGWSADPNATAFDDNWWDFDNSIITDNDASGITMYAIFRANVIFNGMPDEDNLYPLPDGTYNTYYTYQVQATCADEGDIVYALTDMDTNEDGVYEMSFNLFLDPSGLIYGSPDGITAGGWGATYQITATNIVTGASTTEVFVLYIDKMSLALPALDNDIYNYSGNTIAPAINDYDYSIMLATGNLSGTNAGDYTLTISLLDTYNYQWADGSTAPITLSWAIEKAVLNMPSLDKTAFDYNGHAFTPVINGYNSGTMLATGNLSAINGGNYVITVSLLDTTNYEWSNSKTAPLTLNWSVTGDNSGSGSGGTGGQTGDRLWVGFGIGMAAMFVLAGIVITAELFIRKKNTK